MTEYEKVLRIKEEELDNQPMAGGGSTRII